MVPFPETPEADLPHEHVELTSLLVPRGQDRRQNREDGPPWITGEGFVMEERRENGERRNKTS